ncbi:MAG: hypothetical protein U1E29_12775 [Coriobacteriia bacterium]|nr:hypothetical protein [Coriobacteriia bacterium]
MQSAESLEDVIAFEQEDSGKTGCSGTAAQIVMIPLSALLLGLGPIISIAAIALHLFGFDIPLVWLALRLLVIISVLQALLLFPVVALSACSLSKRRVRHYPHPEIARRMVFRANMRCLCQVTPSVLAAIAAFQLHDVMMSSLGNPWADVLTTAIATTGFLIGLYFPAPLFERWVPLTSSAERP